jgi:hypothetical protein
MTRYQDTVVIGKKAAIIYIVLEAECLIALWCLASYCL